MQVPTGVVNPGPGSEVQPRLRSGGADRWEGRSGQEVPVNMSSAQGVSRCRGKGEVLITIGKETGKQAEGVRSLQDGVPSPVTGRALNQVHPSWFPTQHRHLLRNPTCNMGHNTDLPASHEGGTSMGPN